MAAQIRSNFVAILQAVQTQLAKVTGLPTTRVLLVARRASPKFQGDSDILVRPGRFISPPEERTAAGYVELIIRRLLIVQPRVRRLADMPDRDDIFLTDAALGYFTLEENIVNALSNFEPTDASGNVLTFGTIQLRSGAEVQKETEDKAPGWGFGGLEFEIPYFLNVSQTLNAP